MHGVQDDLKRERELQSIYLQTEIRILRIESILHCAISSVMKSDKRASTAQLFYSLPNGS